MKTEVMTGDILKFPRNIDIVIHGCNTLNVFGSGIAKQIVEQFPEVYEADCEAKRLGHNKLGYFSGSKINGLDDKYIINLYIQDGVSNHKRMLNYEAIYSGFERIVKLLNERDIEDESLVIGFPKIGCGYAKGNWTIVKTMIRETFKECKKVKKIVFVNFHG
jgi:O-acetyl-ADP-ribose deacetylase (regulator of RNase III)